jgi:hypothetical protein
MANVKSIITNLNGNVIINNESDNGARLQVTGNGTISGDWNASGYVTANGEGLAASIRVGGIYGHLGLYVPSTYDMQFDLGWNGSFKFTRANVDRFRIDSSGVLFSNSGYLAYGDGTFTYLYAPDANGGITMGDATAPINVYYNDTHTFQSAGQLANYGGFTSTGFGVGTVAPSSKLEVVKQGNASGGTMLLSGSKTNNATKYGIIATSQYASDTETEGVGLIGGVNTSGENIVVVGGGIDEINTATSIRFFTASNTTTRGSANERMRLSSNGNLLIGTTSDAGYKLDVSGSARISSANGLVIDGFNSNTGLRLNYGNASGEISVINILANGITNGYIGIQMVDSSNGDLWFGGSGNRAMTVYRNGNVGIGTSGPTQKLQVVGNIRIDSGTSYNNSGGLYLSNERAAIISNIVNLTANGDTSLDFRTQSAGAVGSAIFINEFRQVGVGTTGPRTKTEFSSGLPTSIPTHTNTTNGIVVTDGGDIYGRIGVSNFSAGGNGYPTYIQAGDWSGAIYYNLLLNPLGGKVGIGTSSPTGKLTVKGALHIERDVTSDYSIIDNDGNLNLKAATGGGGGNFNITFATVGSERMRITSDGNLLVGATNPDVGGSVKGAIIRQDGSIVAARNIASPFHYQSPISADRMNTMGDGVMYSMWRQGVFQAGIGATNAAAMTFFTGDNSSMAEQMRITSAGNVGIGTTNPGFKLNVVGGNGNQLGLDNAGERFTQISFLENGSQNSAIWLDGTDNMFDIYANTSHGIRLKTGGDNPRLIVTSGGNVLIGTTTDAGFKLRVNGTSYFDAPLSCFTGAGYITAATNDGVGSANGFGYSFLINNFSQEIARITGNYQDSGSGGTGGMSFYTRLAGTLYQRLTIGGNGAATFSETLASKDITINESGSGALTIIRQTNGYGATINFKTSSTLNWYLGTRGLVDNNFYIVNEGLTTNNLILNASTGAATFSSSVTAGNQLSILGTDGGGKKLYFTGGTTKYNFMIAAQENVDNALEITPSSAAGGSTFSTPAVVINSSGNVLIGTTANAGFKLDVSGTGRFSGNLLSSNNQNNSSVINISNTTAGTLSQSTFQANSDATSGYATFGKFSSSTTAYKIIAASNAFLYTDKGDIAILNDNASGAIKLAAGGSSLAHLTIASTGAATFSSSVTATNYISNATSGIIFDNTSGGTNATQIRLQNTGGNMRAGVESSTGETIQFGTLAYAAVFGNQANAATQFTTNGTTRMTITSGGNVGIGTAGPTAKLTVVKSTRSNTLGGSSVLQISDASATGQAVGDRAEINFYTNSDSLPGNLVHATIGIIKTSDIGNETADLYFGTSTIGGSPVERMRITSGGNTQFILPNSGNSVSTGNITLLSTATAVNDRLTINFAQTGIVSRARAGIGSVAEESAGYAAALAFYTRNAVDGSDLATTNERMRITSAGSVFINSTSMDGKLGIDTATSVAYNPNAYNGTNANIRLTNGSAGVNRYTGIAFGGGGATEAFIGSVQNSGNLAEIVFQTYNGSAYGERARITSAGNVGIGTTVPGEKLDVIGNIALSGIFKGTTTGENKNFASYDWHWLGRRYAGYVSDVRLKLYEYFYTTTATVQEAFVNCYDMSSVNYMGENIWGDVHLYRAIFTTHIYVKREFTVSSVLLNGDDPYALWIDGAYVTGADSCCTGVTYSYTFTQGWHRIDLIYSENAGGHFVQLGWNPKDYTDYIAAMTPFGPVNFYDTGDVTMRNNNVGIGTTTPGDKLHVKVGTVGGIRIEATDEPTLYMNTTDGTSNVVVFNAYGNFGIEGQKTTSNYIMYHYGGGGTAANQYTYFQTAGSERMRITGAGNVGINNTNPSYRLDVTGDARINTGSLGVNVAPSATDGRIDASNDIVAFQTSDKRLKENITPITNALEKVKSLTGVEFDWKEETKHVHGYEGHDTGIIAQQVLEVMPTAVRTNDTGYLSVRYEKLIGLLIEGMKEQQAQIDELRSKLK